MIFLREDICLGSETHNKREKKIMLYTIESVCCLVFVLIKRRNEDFVKFEDLECVVC